MPNPEAWRVTPLIVLIRLGSLIRASALPLISLRERDLRQLRVLRLVYGTSHFQNRSGELAASCHKLLPTSAKVTSLPVGQFNSLILAIAATSATSRAGGLGTGGLG